MKNQFLSINGNKAFLSIHVQARASKDAIIGPHGDSLKVSITAPPVDNKANEHLIKFLAKYFGVAKNQISIVRGEHNRNKVVCINGASQKIIAIVSKLPTPIIF